MTFESRLADAFSRYADLAPLAVNPGIAEEAIGSGRGRRFGVLPWARRRGAVAYAALALVLLALLAAALVVGSLINRPGRVFGAFSEAGPSQIQFIVAAAALDDGRVVVFGDGVPTGDGSAALTRIELFDPTTKTFAPMAAMSPARSGFSATALRDGKVLIAGGDATSPEGGPTSTDVAQLLDPRTGGFASTASMGSARTRHTATLLADGRVVVIGGQSSVNGDTTPLWSAEIYDPGSGAWSDAGFLTAHRSAYSTTLLPDGRVLLAGGWDDEGYDLRSVEVFEPATSTFGAAGEMLTMRRSPAAALLADGRVLIVGGYIENSVISSAEVFDPTIGGSTPTGSMTTERHDSSALPMADGRVLVAGGGNVIGGPLGTEIYDPATGKFTQGAFAAHEHGGPSVVLRDGRVLLTGSANEIFDPYATTEIAAITPRSDGLFRVTGEPVADRIAHTATKLADGRVLIAGGLASRGARGQDYSALGTAEIYDPRTGTFTSTGPLLVPPDGPEVTGKLGNDAVLLDDGKVLMLVQKHRRGMGPQWTLQAYDPATGRFTTEGTIESANEAESPVQLLKLSDGRLTILGAPLTRSDPPSADMVLYQVNRPSIEATIIGKLPGCGTIVEAVVASGDRIAVLCRVTESEASVRLFDPATGTSSRVEVAMSSGSAALVGLRDGRLLVAGGSDRTALTLVDPTSMTSTPAGVVDTAPRNLSLWPPTAGISMTVLPDGRVLILSGSEASVWDPTTATARPIPGPTTARDGHSSTLLDDGHVLVFGGTTWPADNGVPQPPGAELFDPAAIP